MYYERISHMTDSQTFEVIAGSVLNILGTKERTGTLLQSLGR